MNGWLPKQPKRVGEEERLQTYLKPQTVSRQRTSNHDFKPACPHTSSVKLADKVPANCGTLSDELNSSLLALHQVTF